MPPWGAREDVGDLGALSTCWFCLPHLLPLVACPSPVRFRDRAEPSPSPQDQPASGPQIPTIAQLPWQQQPEFTVLGTGGRLSPGMPPLSQNLIFVTAIKVVLHNRTYINTEHASVYLVKIHEFRFK